MLDELWRDNSLLRAAVLAGALLNAIALPVLISLLWRLHDDRSKLLETKSPKAVWDQVSALRQLQDWEAEQLRSEIAASEEKLRTVLLVCQAHSYDSQWRLVEEAKSHDTELWFTAFDSDDRQFMEEVQLMIGEAHRKGSSQGCWNPFADYEKHLEAQLNKLNQSGETPSNKEPQADA